MKKYLQPCTIILCFFFFLTLCIGCVIYNIESFQPKMTKSDYIQSLNEYVRVTGDPYTVTERAEHVIFEGEGISSYYTIEGISPEDIYVYYADSTSLGVVGWQEKEAKEGVYVRPDFRPVLELEWYGIEVSKSGKNIELDLSYKGVLEKALRKETATNQQTLDVSYPHTLGVRIYLNESRTFYRRGTIVRANDGESYYLLVNTGTQTYSYKRGEDLSYDGYLSGYYLIEDDGVLYGMLEQLFSDGSEGVTAP